MTDYTHVTRNGTETYIVTAGDKPLAIGRVSQDRPGLFRRYLFPKPIPLEKAIKAQGNVQQHHHKRRSDAIWALKEDHEARLKEVAAA